MVQKMIFVDLDDVLCDFRGAAYQIHGTTRTEFESVATPDVWPMQDGLAKIHGKPYSLDDFWKPIHQAGHQWWCDLNPLEHFVDLLFFVKQMSKDNWYILTGPSRDPYCLSGKAAWVRNVLGSQHLNRLIPMHDKHLLSGSGRILIDDREENCIKWEKHGGQAVLFPSFGNRLHALREGNAPLIYVKSILEGMA